MDYRVLEDGTIADSIFDPRYSPFGPLPDGDQAAAEYMTSHHRLATMCALDQKRQIARLILRSIPLSSLAFVARAVIIASADDPDALVVVTEAATKRLPRRR